MGMVSEGEGSCNDGGSGRGDEGRCWCGNTGDGKILGNSYWDGLCNESFASSGAFGNRWILSIKTGSATGGSAGNSNNGSASNGDVSSDSPRDVLHVTLESEGMTGALVGSGGGRNPTPKVGPHGSGLVWSTSSDHLESRLTGGGVVKIGFSEESSPCFRTVTAFGC